MKEILVTNFQNLYQAHETSIFLGSTFLGFLLILFLSNEFQRKFSKENKPNKFITLVFSLFVFFCFSLTYLLTSNLLQINNHKNNSNTPKEKENHSHNNTEENINLFLLALNCLFYLIIPFAYFILIEEKNANFSENNYENLYDGEKSEKSPYNEIECGINSVNYSANEYDNLRTFKNFCFYLIILVSLNVIYLINFKIFSINPKNLLEIYSFIPEKMRIYSTFNSDLEFLMYINIFNVYLFFKIFSIFYLPYGLGKFISLQIDNMKNNVQINFEYKKLNTNLSKNHEVIKQITQQKLMTGKNLTKKEKLILRQCKENNTHLEHKQEILEEKYSKIKIFFEYLFLPVKFLAIIFSIFLTIVIIFSKISALYSNIFQSNCGFYCGYYSDKIISSIGFEDIYENILAKNEKIFFLKSSYFVILLMCLICFYLLLSIFYAVKNLGLFNLLNLFSREFYRNESNKFVNMYCIRSDKILSFTVYVIYLILAIFGIFEVFNMSNKISNFMENFNRCNLNLIDQDVCNFSYFMLFKLKNSFNFSMGMILVQFLEGVSVLLLIIFTIILPIKSTSEFFTEKLNSQNNNENYQKENLNIE